jgi:chromate transporter
MAFDVIDRAMRNEPAAPQGAGDPIEVFAVAFRLGLSAFGGPVAHLGYFERIYVERRRWLSAEDYAGLVALCQMLPGPTSSQVGFLVGLRRAGWLGAAAAWVGFTLPSAVLMLLFAYLSPRLDGPLAKIALHGLNLVAVAVVAQAVWSMARKLCPDLKRAVIGSAAAAALLIGAGPLLQVFVLVSGGALGVWLCRREAVAAPPALAMSPKTAWVAGGVFLAVLAVSLAVAPSTDHSAIAMAAAFYRAGAMVFGGGHVVLPLLRGALVPTGWLSDQAFLSGYGAAQAVPGPLFTFGAYLGAVLAPHGSGMGGMALWSSVALTALFLPGLLAAAAGSSLWTWLGAHPSAQGALAGVNAAVVGVLGAALYNPIWTNAIFNGRDLAIVLVGWMLLERLRLQPILLVAFCLAGVFAFWALGW